MIVPKAILDQHVAILGKTRSGKSSVMRLLVEGLLDRQLPVCIIDPKGDWWGIKLAADGKQAGYPVVIFGGEHADIPINEHAGAHVAELFATGNRPCLIDLGGWMVAPRTRFWIDFASTLFKYTKGQRWLAVDEIHNFAPKGKVFDADAGKALHWTNRLASEGLGKGVAMLFASQRPQKVHNDTLTSAETLIAMRVLHPSDRGAVADWIKGCGDSEGSEVLNSLAQMDRGEGWVWSPEINFGPKRVKFPLFHTYDSFRPQSIEETKKLKGWAEVDLEDVRIKMAATIEKAKADDPRELRRQIETLKKQIVTQQNVAPPQEKLARDKPVLTDADRALLDKNWNRIFELSNLLNTRTSELVAGIELKLGELMLSLQADLLKEQERTRAEFERRLEAKGFQKILDKLATLPTPIHPTTHAAPRSPQARRVDPAPSTSRPARLVSTGDGDASIGKSGLRRMLIALAQRPQGLTRQQLGLRATVSAKGGSFDTYLSKARVNGWIDSTGDRIVITEAGLAALGGYEPLPEGRELLAHYLRQFGSSGAARMLSALAEAYPRALTRGELSAAANISAEGGSFDTYLSKLRTLELVEGRSELRASEELFT